MVALHPAIAATPRHPRAAAAQKENWPLPVSDLGVMHPTQSKRHVRQINRAAIIDPTQVGGRGFFFKMQTNQKTKPPPGNAGDGFAILNVRFSATDHGTTENRLNILPKSKDDPSIMSSTAREASRDAHRVFRTGKNEWHSNSKSEPCPVCGKDHNCKIANNGSAALCARVPSGKQYGGGQYLHLLDSYRPPQRHQNAQRSRGSAKPTVKSKSTKPTPIKQTVMERQRQADCVRRRGAIGRFRDLPVEPESTR